MHSRWPAQANLTFWVMLLATAIGLLVDQLLLVLFLGVSVCLVWHQVRLYRLERWIRKDMRVPPPLQDDIWDDVYRRILRLRHRGRKRKRKLEDWRRGGRQ